MSVGPKYISFTSLIVVVTLFFRLVRSYPLRTWVEEQCKSWLVLLKAAGRHTYIHYTTHTHTVMHYTHHAHNTHTLHTHNTHQKADKTKS